MVCITYSGKGVGALRDIHDLRRANVVDQLEHHYLVGRDAEIRCFLERLHADAFGGEVMNIYGTGGVGKSFLLGEFRRLAEREGVKFLLLDSRLIPGNPADFCLHLLRVLRYPSFAALQDADVRQLIDHCLLALEAYREGGRMVFALDTFESFGEMEHWLREHFLTQLNADMLVIIAGRFPLQGAWLSSPAWRELLLRMPLSGLDDEAFRLYLHRCGIDREETIRHVWGKTKGHPLTLSLLVATMLARSVQQVELSDEQEVFSQVVGVWMSEVLDPDLRELVESATVVRHFNQDLLGYVLDKPVPTERFQKLIGLSFVQRVERGWLIHDLLRDAALLDLRMRRPEHHQLLWKRCVQFYYDKMKQHARKREDAWENSEILYYIGNHFLQHLLYRATISYSVEPLQPANWAEAEHYIAHRRNTPTDAVMQYVNRETNEREEYVITAEESMNILNQIRLQELYELDRSCVKLIRNADGIIYGLMEIIPINASTMDYLRSKPISAAYFNALSDSERGGLMVPGQAKAGYFVKTLDVYDFSDVSMMHASLHTFITHILTAGYVVAAPTENPISNAICTSLGLEVAEGVSHCDYDGKTPSRYYFMDTRGRKIHRYLSKMIASFSLPEDEPGSRTAGEDDESGSGAALLSGREQELAELLVSGRSNKEIANELYISEATVKKHISNMLRKLNVKNRVQLIRKCAK